MAVKKISIALESPVAEGAKRAADGRGMSLSAWLNEAAERALAIQDGLVAVAEWEAEHGALTEEDLAAADAILDAHLGK